MSMRIPFFSQAFYLNPDRPYGRKKRQLRDVTAFYLLFDTQSAVSLLLTPS